MAEEQVVAAAVQPVAGQDPAAEAQVEEKPQYTNKQLNDLLVRDASKEVKKMLAEAGFDTSGDIKADLAKLKSIRDEKMTDSEKTAAALKAKDDAVLTAKAEADAARAEVEAFKAGVSAANLAKVIKLAGTYEGATMAEKIAAVLADFPMMGKANAAPAGGGSLGVETRHEELSEVEAMLAKARKQAGLTK